MQYKAKTIIFSDLDSTLLRSNHYFSKKTKEIIEVLYKQGIYFVPITARATSDLLVQAKRLGIKKMGGIAIANNGSQIYDFKNKTWVLNEYIPADIVQEIFEENYSEIDEKRLAKIHFYSDDSTFVFNEGKNSLYWAQMMASDYIVAHSYEEMDAAITHLTIVLRKDTTLENSKKFIDNLKSKYGDKTFIQVYTDRVIEIGPKNINKGYGVQKVKDYLGIDESVTVYGFGDGYNDLSLFDAVDIGVAMENAASELKAIADDQTKYNNDNDGVAQYIIEKILKK
ncbi:HAD superfamily hydrolase [Williamsoniiplasma somnilux]|uniref:HAD superfamily hydrolase n=1 Tax=Williamsoniiplasma somnilux TaxID=215578 RepID=A0A2K8P0L7_9MOLU|nr:Cof-type HAD-IIB family hydrolase [Williamsoniiplasma somnilux]ATZ18978.1 HAD superfamily hydrolase [Williamsoniiplasma somnilux]